MESTHTHARNTRTHTPTHTHTRTHTRTHTHAHTHTHTHTHKRTHTESYHPHHKLIGLHNTSLHSIVSFTQILPKQHEFKMEISHLKWNLNSIAIISQSDPIRTDLHVNCFV